MNSKKSICVLISVVMTITMFFNVSASNIDASAFDSGIEGNSKYSIYTASVSNFIDELISRPNFATWGNYNIVNIQKLYSPLSEGIIALLYDIEDNNGDTGFLVINYSNYTIIEFAKGKSIVSSYLENNVMREEEYKLYYSPLSFNICFICNNSRVQENIVYDCATGDIVEYNNEYNLQKKDISSQITTQVLTEKYIQKSIEANEYYTIARTYPTYLKISAVPDYIQHTGFLCIPSSMLNIIDYWDKNGYPNLMTSTLTATENEILSVLNNNGGTGSNDAITGAIDEFATSKGYYGNAVSIDDPYFFDLQFEINYGDPCFIGLSGYPYSGPHMTTGVGYDTLSNVNYSIVHDNHSDTIEDYYVQFSYVNFISGISISS